MRHPQKKNPHPPLLPEAGLLAEWEKVQRQKRRGKAQEASPSATPGCECGVCRRLRKMSKEGPPSPFRQMGREQHVAVEQGWQDGGADHKGDLTFGHLRPAERADRDEREATGQQLPAAYRHLLGPRPNLTWGDRVAARAYLTRIEGAIAVAGWTRSEWARLYALRDKWRARAEGKDRRFNEVGNHIGGLDRETIDRIRHNRIVDRMQDELQMELDHAINKHRGWEQE